MRSIVSEGLLLNTALQRAEQGRIKVEIDSSSLWDLDPSFNFFNNGFNPDDNEITVAAILARHSSAIKNRYYQGIKNLLFDLLKKGLDLNGNYEKLVKIIRALMEKFQINFHDILEYFGFADSDNFQQIRKLKDSLGIT